MGFAALQEEVDDAEAKATSLFRNQLLKHPPQTAPATVSQSSKSAAACTTQQVNVLQKEPRVRLLMQDSPTPPSNIEAAKKYTLHQRMTGRR